MVNELFYSARFDPNARVGQRGEILLKEMKFLSIDDPRRTPREISRKKNSRVFGNRQEKNRSVNATLVPILPLPKVVMPRIHQSPGQKIPTRKIQKLNEFGETAAPSKSPSKRDSDLLAKV